MSKVVAHDYGVICAKTQELAVLRGVLDSEFPIRAYNSKPDLPAWVVKSRPDAPPRTLFATCCGSMGHVHAASRTAQMVTRYGPSLMLFVGTAASLDPREIRLGDVVIPQTAFYRIYDKIVQKDSGSFAQAGTKDFVEHFFNDTALLADLQTESLSDGSLIALSGYCPSVQLKDDTLDSYWMGQLKQPRPPVVETDTDIVTCGMVVDSENYKEFLRSKVGRKARTIDMESFGFFKAIKQLHDSGAGENTDGIMIRGISDYGGRKEETEISANWKTVSMINAAMVACDLIKQQVNQSPS